MSEDLLPSEADLARMFPSEFNGSLSQAEYDGKRDRLLYLAETFLAHCKPLIEKQERERIMGKMQTDLDGYESADRTSLRNCGNTSYIEAHDMRTRELKRQMEKIEALKGATDG